MKYLSFIIAIVFFSCSTDSSQSTETTDSESNAQTEVSDDNSSTETSAEVTQSVEPIVIRETVVVNESDIKQNDNVRAAFLNLVDAANNATADDTEKIMALLDEEYAFKGRDLAANSARMSQSLSKFETTYADMNIEGIHSSCDLAYVIASYKRSLTDRETGEVKIAARDKVGLFIMRKNSSGEWKLLVQKTDDGFAHWYYMPSES